MSQASVLFHGSNALIFNTIGSFPLVSLAATLIFTKEAEINAEMNAQVGMPRRAGADAASAARARRHRWSERVSLLLGAAWICVQAAVPLRHHLLTSDVAWTKIGNDFAWRMMSDTTDGWISLNLVLDDPPTSGADAANAPSRRRLFSAHPVQSGAPVTLTAHASLMLLSSPNLLAQARSITEISADLTEIRPRSGKLRLLATRISGISRQYVAAEHAAASTALRVGEFSSARLRIFAECWKGVNGRPYQRWCDATTPIADSAAATTTRSAHSAAYPWMLPRLIGPNGGPSAAEAAAAAAAASWRALGYAVEAFADAAGRPPFRDRILHSAGYAEARLLCAYGEVAVTSDALTLDVPGEGTGGTGSGPTSRVGAGEWHALRVGAWHAVRNAGEGPASWLYVMR